MADTVRLSTIFDGTGYYYSYPGSLTTPGCNEIVTWVVMQRTRIVSQSTLDKFKVPLPPPQPHPPNVHSCLGHSSVADSVQGIAIKAQGCQGAEAVGQVPHSPTHRL